MADRADVAIIGGGIGGLALAGLLSRRGAKVCALRAGKEIRARRRRHPDGPQRRARAVGAGTGAAPAAHRIRTPILEQPRMGYGRASRRAQFCRCRNALWRPLPAPASWRSARGPALSSAGGTDQLRQEAGGTRLQWRWRDIALRRRHKCPGRCRRGRRRRPLEGA